jgi:hypothetical protein
MEDFSSYTDAELEKIANSAQQPMQDVGGDDFSSYSDAELMQIAGIEPEPPQETTLGQKIGAGAVGAADLATFGFSDELMAAGMAALDPNKKYGELLPQVRVAQERVQQGSHKSYLTGQVLGGIGQAAAAAPMAITKGLAGFAGKGMGRSAITGLGAGAASGGLYGFGTGEGGFEEI